MRTADRGQERKLISAFEKAFKEGGYTVSKTKFKHYVIEKNGIPEKIIVRTSTDRWISFVHDGKGWGTLGNSDIDGVIIVAYSRERDPSEICVYPPIPRAELQSRFDQARAAIIKAGKKVSQVWVRLDYRSNGSVWNTAASGIVADLEPLARYPLNPEAEPEPQAEDSQGEPLRSAQQSISMIVDLDEEERRRITERYARDLDLDPRRLQVEVRLTVFR